MVDASIDNIKSHLDYLGFYNSDVSSEITKTGRRVKVQYTVTPGRQYRIDSIRYNVPEGAFGDEFRADLPNTAIKKGDFLSEHLLETESDRGAEFFRNNGYYTFNNGHYFFFADTVSIPGSAVLDYEIRDYSRQDGPSTASALRKFNFGDVTISHAGNIKVNEKFVKSFNSIHPGELYSDKIVNSTYNRFSALKTFNSVNVELNQKDSSTVDCNINLSASSMQGFKVNFETSSSSNGLIGLSPQFSYFHKNLFHNGERFDISLSGDFQFRPKDKTRSNEFGMSTKLSLPGIIFVSNNVFKGNNIPRTEIGLSFNYQNRPEYTKSAISGDLGFTAGTVSGMQFKFNLLQLGFVKVFAISDEFAKTLEKNPLLKYSYQSHLDSGVGLQFVNSNASSSVPKESYHFEYGKIDLSGNLMSLLKLKHFTLAIVDESSQILEPHLIGLLSAHKEGKEAIDKFVLIGDHKQLPAVVQQAPEESVVTEPELNAIGLSDCRNSLFERMLSRFKTADGYDERFVYMLTKQGRMHRTIAEFPNIAFYGGKLDIVPLDHQQLPCDNAKTENSIEKMLSRHRVAFVAAEQPSLSPSIKTNQIEADMIAATVYHIYRLKEKTFDKDKTIGVIVPYRNQISTVRNAIDRFGADVLHDITGYSYIVLNFQYFE